MKPKFWAYLSSIPLTVIEVLILMSPVKCQDNRLTECDGNSESSNGYIMPVGMFVLILLSVSTDQLLSCLLTLNDVFRPTNINISNKQDGITKQYNVSFC